MIQEGKAVAHAYTIELSFYGDQLVPSDISACLKLQPSGSLSQSQIQPGKRRRRPYWGYNGKGELGFLPEWTCLEDGFEFLLKILNPRKPDIVALARQFDAVWWCGHFQTSFDGGPTLSPKLLTEIGSYEIPLSFDNYFSDEE
jgi:Domain of unknown function (DUF4279)